ncbi:DUF5801 repeats-in-toxin domain-containing protein [Rhizobium sp. G187]|uniref:DUF5801 repeats-in-toxin domain-containing protein n=1 Tax=Rhizobium sp. G187 TaxID=3451352 RepID=UPI003EE54E20
MSNQSPAPLSLRATMENQNNEAAVTGRLAPEQVLELAQAQTANTAPITRSMEAGPAKAAIELAPDANNAIILPRDIDLDNADFRTQGADLIVVLSDGSELVITGGAANIPTFMIGDIELPQATLFAALEASYINVAAGPEGYSASTRASDASATFDDNPINGNAEDFIMVSLLEGTAFADQTPENLPSFGSDGRPSIITMNDPIPFDESVIADRDEGNQSYSGVLGFNPGSDFGAISAIGFSGVTNLDESGLGGDTVSALTSGGLPVTIETYPAPDDASVLNYVALRAVDSEGHTVFTVTIDNRLTGEFTFELAGKLDHPDAGYDGEQIKLEDILSLGFTYTVTDRDGDTATGTFRIDVRDDGPTIKPLPSTSLDEEDLTSVIGNPGDSYDTGDLSGHPGTNNGDGRSVSASLGIDWGADDNSGKAGALVFIGYDPRAVIDETSGEPVEQLEYRQVYVNSEVRLTSAEQQVFYFVTEIDGQSALIGFTGDDPASEQNWVFTVTLDNGRSTGSYHFTLLKPIDHKGFDVEDDLRFDFDFRATDSDGDSTDGRFSVVINDDAPTASIEAGPSQSLEDAAQTALCTEDGAGRIVSGEAGDLLQVGADGMGSLSIHKGSFSVVWQLEEGTARIETVTWGDGKPASDGSTTFVATGVESHQTAAILTIYADGSYSFEMTAAYAHEEGRDSGSINIGFTVTDKDGDTAYGEMWLHIKDDAPVATETVLLQTMAEGSQVSGELSRVVSFGADGVGGYTVETTNLSASLTSLTSNGQSLSFSVIDNTLYAKAGDTVIFTFAVDETTGAYSFKQLGAIDHLLSEPETSGNADLGPALVSPERVEGDLAGIPTDTLTLDLSSAVIIRDGDGDTLALKEQLQVTITDSKPSFSPVVEALIGEDGPSSVTAKTGIDFGLDNGLARELSLSTGVSATDQNGATVTLTSNGQIVHVALVGSILIGYIGDQIPSLTTDPDSVFSVSVDASNGEYVFELYRPLDHSAPTSGNQYLDMALQLQAMDADGDLANGTVKIRIDASGQIDGTSVSYAKLDTGVFVNLGAAATSREGQSISADTAMDHNGGDIVGRDKLTGLVNAEGSKADDILVGGDEANQLKGGDGNDLLIGGKGADRLEGGDGEDTLIVSADIDDTTGYDLRTFTAGDGSTRLVSISERSGEGDALIGGSGIDTVRFESAFAGQGFVFDRANASLELSGVEKFVGTDGDDVILLPKSYTTSDAAFIEIDGGKGNDILQGSDGQADDIDGGENDDLISGLGGNDKLFGGSGSDQIWGGTGDDKITGGDGNDTLYGNAGDDVIEGGAGNDTIVYAIGDGRDTIGGGSEDVAGRDLLRIDGSAAAENYVIWTRDAYNAAHGASYAGTSEILMTVNGSIVAEVSEIEDITINGNGGADTYSVVGDFTETSLLTSTVTLSGGDASEHFDVSGLTSAHQVVVKAGAGDDSLVIGNANGEFRWQDVKVVKDVATGEFSLSLPNGAVIKATGVEHFQFSNGTVAAEQLIEQAPSDVTSTSLSVKENSADGIAVGRVSGVDPNGDIDQLTYAFVKDGSPSLTSADGRFVIDPTTGVISVAVGAIIDYETTPSVDLEIRVTDSQGQFIDKSFEVDVENVNEAPETANVSASGKEDGLVEVTFSSKDTDGDQAGYVIKSLPGNGQLYLSASSSEPLKVGDIVTGATVYFKPTADYAGVDTFTYAASDAGGLEDATPATATVTVSSEPDSFTFTLNPALGSEDRPIALDFSSFSKDRDGSEKLVLTLNTIPVGTTILDDKGNSFTSKSLEDTVDVSDWDLDSLQVLPRANLDKQFVFFVELGYRDAFDGSSHLIKSNWLVTVTGVADTPTATVLPAVGSEDDKIPLSIEGHLTDTDGSESLHYTISNIPDGTMLVDGKGHAAYDESSVDITGWDLSTLALRPAYNYSGSFNLTVTVTSEEKTSGDTASTTIELPVKVEAVADIATYSLITVSGTSEDNAAAIRFEGKLMDADGSETLSLLISGIPVGTTISDGKNHEFTATEGKTQVDVTSWEHNSLSVLPPANFSGELKLDLVMVATEVSNGDTNATTLPIKVYVKSVNDAAEISGDTSGRAIEATSEDEGQPTATGNLDAVDIDNENDKWIAVSEKTSSAKGYGTFTVGADGKWRYELDNGNTTVNKLNSNETLTDTFEVSTIDGTKQIVTVTINGATDPNSAPTTVADIVLTNQKTVHIPDWTLLYNDTDADGNRLSISGVSESNSGQAYHYNYPYGAQTSFEDYVGSSPSGSYNILGGSFTYSATDGISSKNETVTVINEGSGYNDYSETSLDQILGSSSSEIIIDGVGTGILDGMGGNDIILGNGGYDYLSGGSGDDVLLGGVDTDTLNGGSGADTFMWGAERFSGTGVSNPYFWSEVYNNDYIDDYSYSDGDRIDLNSAISSIASGKTIKDYIDVTHDGEHVYVWVSIYGDGADWQPAYMLTYSDAATSSIIIKAAGQTFTFKDDDANTVIQGVDPVILDLDKNGFALSSINNGVTFDINADGSADQIAWTSEDGILAYDVNGNGTIDNGSEIFTPDFNGGTFASGVAALASLDVNGDGRIDAQDAAFSALKIWVDANSNGISDEGELATLADYGVTEISLAADQTNGAEDGQTIFSEGEFTFTDGSTGSFIEVSFDTIFGSTETEGLSAIGSDGEDIQYDRMGEAILAGADTFVFDETAFSAIDIADVISDHSLSEGDALDVSALLDTLLGEQASEFGSGTVATYTNGDADTSLSMGLSGDWTDVVVLQSPIEAVKTLFDEQHSISVS